MWSLHKPIGYPVLVKMDCYDLIVFIPMFTVSKGFHSEIKNLIVYLVQSNIASQIFTPFQELLYSVMDDW